MAEEEKVDTQEISMDEFETLSDDLKRTVVEREEILAILDGKALTARGVAKEIEVENYATVYGALTRMKKADLVVRRTKGKNVYWSKNPNPPAPAEDEPEEVEDFDTDLS